MTSDDLQPVRPEGPRDGHPILAGLVAFVAVIAVVAGVVAGGALLATRALGLGEGSATDTGQSEQETLFLPRPSETDEPSGPSITLPSQPEPTRRTDRPRVTEEPEPEPITLSAGQTAVGPMEPIDLVGSYPEGEGAILRVQQFQSGSWGDFPVTASVSGGSFSTFIQAGAVGLNRFRMIDTDTGETSNEVKVQIG